MGQARPNYTQARLDQAEKSGPVQTSNAYM